MSNMGKANGAETLTHAPLNSEIRTHKVTFQPALQLSREESTASSSEASPNKNQLQLGELVVLLSKQIAISGGGTTIYEGLYENEPVAVKRILKSHYDLVPREIENFQEFKHHQNIVKYYGMAENEDFYYLALERCDCDLSKLIQPSNEILGDRRLWVEEENRPSALLLKLMSVRDLLRLIRNILRHYEQLPDNIKNRVGSLHEGLDDYFRRQFPELLIEVYKVAYPYYRDYEYYKKYFERE